MTISQLIGGIVGTILLGIFWVLNLPGRIKAGEVSWQQLRLYIVVFVWIILLATVISCAVWLIIKAALFWHVIAMPQVGVENPRKD